MKTKKIMAFFLALVMVMAYLPLKPIASYADDGVEINERTFPDRDFRDYVSQNIDKTPHNGKLSQDELDGVEELVLYWKQFSSLQGIEYFKNLKRLLCFDSHISSLDVSHNPNLTKLVCYDNDLKSLDVSHNPKLTELDCHNAQLKSLDVSHNPNLTNLVCNGNGLTSLDLSNNPSLTHLECTFSQLTSLDLSNNPKLTKLDCYNNNLTSLNVRKNKILTELDCSNQRYDITVVKGIRKFKYSDFPRGFDKDKVTSLVGASLGDDALIVDSDNTSQVTYNYKVDNNREMSVTLNVSYVDFNPISMSVTSQPSKLTYTEDDKLDLSGLVVTLEDGLHFRKVVPFEQFTGNNIATDLDNGTRLIAANHNRAKVKLTYRNLSAYTDQLTVKAKYKVTYKDGVNGAAFQDQVKTDIVTGSDTPAFDGGTPTRAGYVFDKWSPDVASKVTADATYTATWKEDTNGDGTPDDGQDHFTVTYKDGVNGEAFPDQVKSIVSGAPTPAFDGTPTRTGYVFDKWTPDPEGTTVTGNATYVAQWKKPDSKTQHDKHIDMIPQTGESASYAGLLAALGFSISGLAILRKKKMMKENK